MFEINFPFVYIQTCFMPTPDICVGFASHYFFIAKKGLFIARIWNGLIKTLREMVTMCRVSTCVDMGVRTTRKHGTNKKCTFETDSFFQRKYHRHAWFRLRFWRVQGSIGQWTVPWRGRRGPDSKGTCAISILLGGVRIANSHSSCINNTMSTERFTDNTHITHRNLFTVISHPLIYHMV